MNQFYKTFLMYERKINALQQRARVLLTAAIIVMIYYLWQALIFAPIFEVKDQLMAKIKLQQTEIAQLIEQSNTMNETLNANKKNELAERVAALQQEKKTYEDNMERLGNQLIAPKEMAKLLGGILAKDHELALISMENIPQESIFNQTDSAPDRKQELLPAPDPSQINNQSNSKQEPQEQKQIYRHGIKLEFAGTYFATERFLQALEALPWQLLWGEFSYKVSAYPIATVQLEIYTLSLQPACLGT